MKPRLSSIIFWKVTPVRALKPVIPRGIICLEEGPGKPGGDLKACLEDPAAGRRLSEVTIHIHEQTI